MQLWRYGAGGRWQLRKSELWSVRGGLSLQSDPLSCAALAGMEGKGNDKETEDSKWLQHEGQFQDDGTSNQMRVPSRRQETLSSHTDVWPRCVMST